MGRDKQDDFIQIERHNGKAITFARNKDLGNNLSRTGKMKKSFPLIKVIPYLTATLFIGATAWAEDAASVPMLSTGQTILGEPIHYPTTGPAHVTASTIIIAPGASTVLHRHGVPQFAYILSGELTVTYGEKGTRTFKAGDSFMETMDTPHYGTNHGQDPVKILSVFMGAEGSANTLSPR